MAKETNIDKALINLYVKLISRGAKTMEDVPEHLVDSVSRQLENVNYIPREGESDNNISDEYSCTADSPPNCLCEVNSNQ